jgi:hypothetical protein
VGDPQKYSRRRREQLAEERARTERQDPDPFGKVMASGAGRFPPFGCVPGSIGGLLIGSVVIIAVALVVQSC